MDDEEKRLLLNEISVLKKQLGVITGDVKTEIKTAEEYIQDMRLYGDVPKDQFAHQFKLLFHPQSAPKTQMDLLPPDALLGLVKDSKTLLFLQNDNAILNRLFEMGQRNEGIMELFESLFYSWWQQMRMTGTLGGNERWLQSFLEPSSIPYEGFSFLEKREAKKKAKEFGFSNVMKQMAEGQRGKTYI